MAALHGRKRPLTILFDLLGSLAKSTRQSLAGRARRRLGSGSIPGASTERVASAQQKYVWQRLSRQGVADDDAARYEADSRDDTVALLSSEPRFALDVGCYTGTAGRSIKDRFPQCKVWGIEPDARAAELARRHMDKVIVGTFDTVDWSAQRVAVGEIDAVLLLDVLEHMYNPWLTLETLRGLVAPQAQIVISLPNVRNIFILRDLMNGYWRYRDAGLLDATHIRFFSRYEALRLIYQTGFRVATYSFTMIAGTAEIYMQRKDQPFPQRVEFERGSLVIEDLADLQSFVATQHVFVVHPAQRHELSADEAALIDGPHPETFATGEDRPGTL
jgi:2-polyprenyl-3-methyl-5-hydroxy-6-metoxy-1,4-benzoquinol methylase